MSELSLLLFGSKFTPKVVGRVNLLSDGDCDKPQKPVTRRSMETFNTILKALGNEEKSTEQLAQDTGFTVVTIRRAGPRMKALKMIHIRSVARPKGGPYHLYSARKP